MNTIIGKIHNSAPQHIKLCVRSAITESIFYPQPAARCKCARATGFSANSNKDSVFIEPSKIIAVTHGFSGSNIHGYLDTLITTRRNECHRVFDNKPKFKRFDFNFV